MLFLVLGLPGWFAERCQRLTRGLVERAYGSADLIRGDTLEEVALQLLHHGAPSIVLASHNAVGRIRSAIAEAGKPFIVAYDDPMMALAHLVRHREMDLIAATRLVAGGCASVIGFGATPGALVLAAHAVNGDSMSLATAIAGHLGLDVDQNQLDDVVRLADNGDGAGDAQDWLSWWDTLPLAERAIAHGAIAPFIAHFGGAELRPITWSRELFFVGDGSSERADGAIDITGRARCLLSGPDILLPPGLWLVSMIFEFSPEAAEHDFSIEFVGGAAPVRDMLRPEAGGVVEVETTLEFETLPSHPIYLRLWSERAAFDGTVALRHVRLTRLARDEA